MSHLQVPSLSMLSNPLPPVLKQPSIELHNSTSLNHLDSFALQKELQQKHADAPVEDMKAPEDERTVLILHTRDVTDDEEQLCRKFGVIRHFNPSMVNIPLETVKAHYIFVDVRNKYYRINIAKVDVTKFRVCALVNSWEKHNNIFDDFCDVNIMTKLPHDVKVAFKSEFDDLLTNKKLIKSPGNSCLSLLSYLVNLWDELKRKS